MREDIVWLCDNPSSPAHMRQAASLGAMTMSLRDADNPHFGGQCHVVVAADLRNLDTVKDLRAVLARHRAGCRIFEIDPKARVTAVHANVLGAHFQLPAPIKPVEVLRAIKTFEKRTAPRAGSEDITASIDGGFRVLTQAFQASTVGGRLDVEAMLDVAYGIANAIGAHGLPDWLGAVRRHHAGTYQHCLLVTGVAAGFGCRTGMARDDVAKLTLAALLHDVGKARVPAKILDKPGPLTAAEMEIVRTHPRAGFDYLSTQSGIEPDVLGSVLHHHEYLDGSGYPDGLSGASIDDLTRIITIADVYAALVERRSYKPAMAAGEAVAILQTMAEEGKLESALVRVMGSAVGS